MLGLFYLFYKSYFILSVEWYIEITHLENDTTKTPDVGTAVVPLGPSAIRVIQNFGALVQECSNILYDASIIRIASYSKVSNLY